MNQYEASYGGMEERRTHVEEAGAGFCGVEV